MSIRRASAACLVLFQFVLVSADTSSAHMIGPSWENGVYDPGYNNIGYHPSMGDCFLRWFDETGNPAWVEAQRRFAITYYNDHYFWNRQRGVPVPYLDWRTGGGTAGCGNGACGNPFDSSSAGLVTVTVR